MSIPPEIQALVEQLNQALNQTEQDAKEGLKIVRLMLSLFPNNVTLTQYFASFSSVLLFVETYRAKVQTTVEHLSVVDVTAEEFQEAGEELANLWGRILEVKINVSKLKNRLET